MSRFDDNLSVFKRLRAGQQYGERKRGVIGRLDADGRIDADISAGLPAASVWLTLQGERAAVPAKNLRVENAPGLPVIAARSLDTGELEILGVDSLTAVDQFGAAAAGLNSPRKGASIPTPILARDVVTGGVFASGGLTVRMGAFWHAGGYWADSTALTLVPTAAGDRKALVLVGVNKRTNAAATALTVDRAALLPLISNNTPNATAWADIKAVIDAQPHIEWRGAVELANGATSIDPTQIAPLHWRHSTLMGADSSNNGAAGLVPAPSAGDEIKFLRGDGAWHAVSGGGSTKTRVVGTVLYESQLSVSGRFDTSASFSDYDRITIHARVKSSLAGNTADGMFLLFNADTTTANYRYQRYDQDNTAIQGIHADGPLIGFCIAAGSALADNFTEIEITIYNPGTAAHKYASGVSLVRRGNTDALMEYIHMFWENTAAISRIQLQPDGFSTDDFVAGSWIQVIGWKTEEIGGASAGVTSVGLSLPSEFAVSGSPVTSSGTISATWANASANYVFASPNGSAGTPSFRALLAADIPDLSGVYQPLDADLTALAGVTDTGFVRRTGAGTAEARALLAADIPDLSATYAATAHTHSAGDITSGLLSLTRGGTGSNLGATGGTGQFLQQSGVGAAISVGTIASADLATALTTPPAIGGTTPAAGTFTTVDAANAGGFRIRNVTNTDWVEVIKGRIGGGTIRIGSPNNTFELVGTSISFYDSAVNKRMFTMPAANTALVVFNPDYEASPAGNHYMLFYGSTSGRTLMALYANGRDSINFGTQSTETGHFVSMRSVMTTQRTQRWDKLTNQNADLWQVRDESANELLTLAPLGTLTVKPYTNATSGAITSLTLGHNTSGTASAGFGGRLSLQLESSTTENTFIGNIEWLWNVATHASRVPDLVFRLIDYGGTREIMRLRANGTAGALGFFGATPAGQPALGVWAGLTTDQKLDALRDALSTLGLASFT